jgi:hypothetical protein
MVRPFGWSAIVARAAAGFAFALGCAGTAELPSEPSEVPARDRDAAIYREAQDARTESLEREVARLQADLAQAEEEMVTIESGLRGEHSRADAVSTVADVRIAVERAARLAPWRADDLEQARLKLAEAERQLRAGHSGSALFFASRADRIAVALREEAEEVARFPGARFIGATRANLRSGPSTGNHIVSVLRKSTPVLPERSEGSWLLVRTPSGPVGWVHDSVLVAR